MLYAIERVGRTAAVIKESHHGVGWSTGETMAISSPPPPLPASVIRRRRRDVTRSECVISNAAADTRRKGPVYILYRVQCVFVIYLYISTSDNSIYVQCIHNIVYYTRTGCTVLSLVVHARSTTVYYADSSAARNVANTIWLKMSIILAF